MSDLSYSFDNSLDDSSGEALGDALDSSAVDLSGENLSLEQDDTLQGSALDLAGSGADARVFDGSDLSLSDQYSLTGTSEAAPSDSLDTGDSENNGAGSADTVHPATVSSPSAISTIFSGVSKFGASLGQLFAHGGAQTQPRVSTAPANLNPNRPGLTGITSGHAVLIVGLVILAGAVVVSGGK